MRCSGPRTLSPNRSSPLLSNLQIQQSDCRESKGGWRVEDRFRATFRSAHASSRNNWCSMDLYVVRSRYMSSESSGWRCNLSLMRDCKECGKHGALTDFAFRRRLCEPCMVCIFPSSIYLFVAANIRHSRNRERSVPILVVSRTQRARSSVQTMLYLLCFHVLIDTVSLCGIC